MPPPNIASSYFAHAGLFDMAGNYIPHSQIDGDLRAAKVELASRNLRITGLEETLRDMREQLIKARDALGRGHELEVECSRHIGRAQHLLSAEDKDQG